MVGCTLLLVGSSGMRDGVMFFLDTLDHDVSNHATKVILSEGAAMVAAIVLGLVALNNPGVMSDTGGRRELAALKALGFRDKAIGKPLITQNTAL